MVLVGGCVIGNIGVGDISILPRCLDIYCIPGIPSRKHAIIVVLRESTIPTDGPRDRDMNHQASIVNSIAKAESLGILCTCAYWLLGADPSKVITCINLDSPSFFPLGP